MILKQLRKEKTAYTQRQGATLLKVSEPTFVKYENNPEHMSILMIHNLSVIYKVSPLTVYKSAVETWKARKQNDIN